MHAERLIIFPSLLIASATLPAGSTAEWVTSFAPESGFELVHEGRAASVIYSDDDHPVVAIAARDLAADVEHVTGILPAVGSRIPDPAGNAVIVGTLGRNPLIDRMAENRKLDTDELKGAWESFLIATVEDPLPGVASALVIAGSDRRGTAFGIYELSQAIGVSPWYWWADVTPERKDSLFVAAGSRRMGPPSVKYRGIFINDEDWGLHPWAAKTFDPELGDIGPKTYRRVFELLLRLKANTLWPAMHEVTRAFNLYPENRQVANDYAIVMASSHAEPMLRNNVTEWTASHESFNYSTNRDGVLAYWEERLRENGAFENIYTLGMRGIHDSGMLGAMTIEEKVAVLEAVFEDQRGLIVQHVNESVAQVPQVFTPYKEVLDIYRSGLAVPDDVTIVWPDDNHGYIRYFPTAGERQRAGGFGVYYHLSYLGAPLAYLWLHTTPPALVWQEMNKAYDLGARTLWIVNVGDIKPAEIGMEFFLQMAWNIDRWPREKLPGFLPDWAAREFDSHHGDVIGAVLSEYFTLNFQRRPEHLQWWMPHTRVRPSTLTPVEIEERLAAFAGLTREAQSIGTMISPSKRDAFFELVEYPVRAAALANQRYFHAEEYNRLFNANPASARAHGAQAREADRELTEITRVFNEDIAEGKWRHFMAVEPADGMWRSYRLTPPPLPAENMTSPVPESAAVKGIARPTPADQSGDMDGFTLDLEAEDFTRQVDHCGVGWRVIPGLGRTGDSVAVFPVTAASYDVPSSEHTPRLEYDADLPLKGKLSVHLNLIPTHPIVDGIGLRVAVSINDQPVQLVVVNREVGDRVWSESVLDATITGHTVLEVPQPGTHTLKLWMVDPGVVVDRIQLRTGDEG